MKIVSGTGCVMLVVGLTTLIAGQGLAQVGIDSNKQCSATYTDCAGVTREVEWECSSNQDCCTNTYIDDGPDGQQGTADDCIAGLTSDCDQAPCDKIEWISDS